MTIRSTSPKPVDAPDTSQVEKAVRDLGHSQAVLAERRTSFDAATHALDVSEARLDHKAEKAKPYFNVINNIQDASIPKLAKSVSKGAVRGVAKVTVKRGTGKAVKEHQAAISRYNEESLEFFCAKSDVKDALRAEIAALGATQNKDGDNKPE